MEIEFLRHFGFKPEHIQTLQAAYGPQLLPLQERAVSEGKLFDGANLVLCGPTSSGKTFLAETLFLHHALQGRNAALLVPTKALANQRYAEWKARYEPLGYKITLSTRDHRFDDDDVRRGDFHLAIVIYEKMRSLLATDAGALASLGACLIDELHYLYDAQRGPMLELLLNRLRSNPKLQMLGLSAMVNDPIAAEWLGGQLIVEESRPVELRQGVLCNGRFIYQECNSGDEGTEEFPLPPLEDEGEAMLEAARCFAERGETTLLFWPRRDLCYTAARKLAEGYEPDETISMPDAEHLEATAMSDLLRFLLPRRVAVHTSDLNPAERAWVEASVLRGDAVIVCATSTLAEGLNFPVVNALTTRRMYATTPEDARSGKPPSPAPIPPDRLWNMLGRAGRLGLSEFGRGMVLCVNEGDAEGLLNLYARAKPQPAAPLLHHLPAANLVLQCASGERALSPEDVLDELSRTLTARWGLMPDDLPEQLERAFAQLRRDGLLITENGRDYLTPLGRAAASGGLSLHSVLQMSAFIQEHWSDGPEALILLWRIVKLQEMDDAYLSVPRREIAAHVWPKAMLDLCEEEGVWLHPLIQEWAGQPQRMRDAHHRACKKALLLWQWSRGEPTAQLESRFHAHSGAIQRLGEEAAWLLGCLADIAASHACSVESVQALRAFQEQIQHGLPSASLRWADSIQRQDVTRTQALQLTGMDIASPESAQQHGADALKPMLPEAVIQSLFKTPSAPAPQQNATGAFRIRFDAAKPNCVCINGVDVKLTRLQAQLLKRLASEANVCVDYETLLSDVWPESIGERKQISRQKNEIYKRVERALGRKPENLIQTTPGVGLALVATIETP
ncbi:MAG: DEAD/DEAH box helicase [Candidatus Hinthialibacter antarcticus]|nr:DEAD/DEAH box helicase [Candidatus Hinthialibacter antarcticus]